METKSRQSNGGLAWAKIQKERAREKYLASPNLCTCCGKTLLPYEGQKISEVRAKKFCDHTCAAIFNNRKRKKPEKIKIVKEKRTIDDRLKSETKQHLFQRSKNWQTARTEIRRHALFIAGRGELCESCGYSNHTEICHKKAVSDFSGCSTIGEINARDNLVFLCPNCHWEFDNGILALPPDEPLLAFCN